MLFRSVLNSSELHAPLQKNQVVGTINFQLDGKTIEQRPLVVLQEIPEGNFFGKIIDYIKFCLLYTSRCV